MIEVDQEIILNLLDEEHETRLHELEQLKAFSPDNHDRRVAREHLRYEMARSAFRLYNLSVEEWEDEYGIDDPSKYQNWRNYL